MKYITIIIFFFIIIILYYFFCDIKIYENFYSINNNDKLNNKILINYYKYEKTPFPIDVVYTWSGENNQKLNIRFNNFNELKYSLRSVKMFIPWVNHIYIFMNPPKAMPSWMKKCDYITLLDHTIFFSEKVSNSNLIETYLPYIPNLSEHFIYLNDDIFILQKLSYNNFFTKDGRAIVSKTKYEAMYKNINTLGFDLPNFGKWYLHIPINIIKSEAIKYHTKYRKYIEFVRQQKTRNIYGCNICKKYNLKCPCQQQHYPLAKFMLNNNKAVEYDYTSTYLYWSMNMFKNNKQNHFKNIKKQHKYLCVNNTELDKIKTLSEKKKVTKIFNNFASEYFNIKPEHEK